MLFILTALDKGQLREFTIYDHNLENGLESVSCVAKMCERLVSVTVKESELVLHLPAQIFDGQPFKVYINQLEQQWQKALSSPTAVPTSKQIDQKDWYEEQINRLLTTITDFHRLIETLNSESRWLLKAYMNDACRSYLLSCNERSLGHYQRCLAITHRQLKRYSDLLLTISD